MKLSTTKTNGRDVNERPGNADRHLAHEVVAGHHHHDARKGAGNHHNIDHATTVHIAKPTRTMHRWNIVDDPTSALVTLRQADSASTASTGFDPTSPRGQKPSGYSTGFAVTDAPSHRMLTLHHANARVMTYTPYVNMIQAIQISNAYTGCVTNVTCSARSNLMPRAATT